MPTFTQEQSQQDNGKRYVTVNSIDQVVYTPRQVLHTFNYTDIVPYGNFDNLYPQKVISVAQKSWALTSALETFKDFIIGDGLGEQDQLVINEKEQTLFELLTYIAKDKSKFGFAIHVNYNALGQITELQTLDFEDLRFNNEAKIVYNPDWSNRYATENHEKETVYNLFKPETVLEEIKEVGIENYTGQIYYYTGQNKLYPLSTFDSALEAGQYQADQSLASLRNIQNGFSLGGAFIYPKNLEHQDEKQDVLTDLNNNATGGNNQGRIWTMGVPAGIEGIEKMTQFIPFERTDIDSLYTNQNKEAREAVFSVFRQPAILNAISESGMFNQQSLQDAFVFYNSIVEKDRKEVEKTLNKIMSFSVWGNLNLTIKPKTLIKSEDGNNTIDTNET